MAKPEMKIGEISKPRFLNRDLSLELSVKTLTNRLS